MYKLKYKFDRFERYKGIKMIKKLNIFITAILTIEVLSLVSGYGTHYQHSSYALMLGIISVNLLILKNDSLLKLVKIKVEKE